MAITVDGEIEINSLKYHIVGPGLIEQYLSPLPGKVNMGGDSFAQENILSNWIQSDRRGGILINDMDESIHSNRLWWTDCIISHDGHLTLPRKATSLSALSATPSAVTITNADFETDVSPESGFGWTEGAGQWSRSSAQARSDTYSWLNTTAVDGDSIYQDISGYTPGVEYTFKCWIHIGGGSGSTYKLGINDGVGTTYGSAVGVFGSWAQMTVTRTLGLAATQLRLIIECEVDTGSRDAYFDDATLTATSITVGDFVGFANFNGEKYAAFGRALAKLASGRAGYELVAYFTTSIVRLIPSLNSRLYIFMGDSTNYWYMSTTELSTQSNSSAAYYAIEANGLLYKMNSTGTFASSNDPDGGSPTWNNLVDVTTDSDKIEGIMRGRDADGNFVVYCPTNTTLQVYDATNDKWLPTELRLPDHPNGGKGAIYWNDAHYFSYGLGVKKYVTGNPASISEVGLEREGGLPVEYNGEIVAFSADSQYFLAALVDASQTSLNSKSGLYIWTGIAWECWWVDSSNNGAMNDVVVSSAESGYAIYWDTGGTIYYIDLPRGIQNVRQLAGTQKFEASGIFLSPWFDAGTVAYSKLVQKVTSYAKSVNSNETIDIKYRTNHSTEKVGSSNLLKFNGTANSQIDCGAIYNSQAKLAISFDFKLDAAHEAGSTGAYSFGKWGDSNNYLLIELDSATGRIRWKMATSGVVRFELLTTQTSWNANQWYHVIASISSANGVRLRVDNGTAVTDADTNAAPSSGNFIIGSRVAGVINNFDGAISNFSVFTDDLSTAEEAKLFNGIEVGDETDYWEIDEGTGITITSTGSAANSGTAGSATSWVHNEDTVEWSALAFLNASGENGAVETLLASGAGLSFDAFQYRIDLARGSTMTDSPDLLALVTAYMLKTGATGNRGWIFTINIDGELGDADAHQQYDNIWSAITSGTLIPFNFRNEDVNETHYVILTLTGGTTLTGSEYGGQMSLTAIKV